MKDIEILNDEAGAPQVALHGSAKAAADGKGIANVHISLSHSDVRISFLRLLPDPALTVTCRLSPLRLPRPRLLDCLPRCFPVSVSSRTFVTTRILYSRMDCFTTARPSFLTPPV
jgi:hypothetical protein